MSSVRASFDRIAEAYAAHFPDDLAERAMFAAFAELVTASGGGPVVDLGCGPGHTTARVRALGLDVSGIDLSPGMVAVANREHPDLDVAVGSVLALDRPDASLAGALCFYSLVNVAPPQRPAALAEVARVLVDGGHLLVGFQVGDEARHHDEAWGHPVDLTFWRLSPDAVVDELAAAGLDVQARLVRAPIAGEHTPQAVLLARRTRRAGP